MNTLLQSSVAPIVSGIFKLALSLIFVGIISFLASRKFAINNPKKRKKIFELTYFFGILIIGVFLIPLFFRA